MHTSALSASRHSYKYIVHYATSGFQIFQSQVTHRQSQASLVPASTNISILLVVFSRLHLVIYMGALSTLTMNSKYSKHNPWFYTNSHATQLFIFGMTNEKRRQRAHATAAHSHMTAHMDDSSMANMSQSPSRLQTNKRLGGARAVIIMGTMRIITLISWMIIEYVWLSVGQHPQDATGISAMVAAEHAFPNEMLDSLLVVIASQSHKQYCSRCHSIHLFVARWIGTRTHP